jgi:hypothetical protein
MARSETDMKRYDWSRAERGKYAAKARRSLASFEAIYIDKKLAKTLGGPDAIRKILEALGASLASAKKKRHRAA